MIGRPVPEAYRTALDLPCPTCGAAAGDFCTRTDGTRARRIRRAPCVKRCPPSRHADDGTAAPTRSFSEPVHQLDDDSEGT